jgi:hypothetical protein
MRRGGTGSRKRLHVVIIWLYRKQYLQFPFLGRHADLGFSAGSRLNGKHPTIPESSITSNTTISRCQSTATISYRCSALLQTSQWTIHMTSHFFYADSMVSLLRVVSFQGTHLNPSQRSDQDSSVYLRDDSGQCTKVTAARESWYASHSTKTKYMAMFGIIGEITSQSRNSGI